LQSKDVKIQSSRAEAAQKPVALQSDPKAWIKANYLPFEYETKATIDWGRWIPRQH
jgi:hypothetical protein